jgi:ankyrin repeat protein
MKKLELQKIIKDNDMKSFKLLFNNNVFHSSKVKYEQAIELSFQLKRIELLKLLFSDITIKHFNDRYICSAAICGYTDIIKLLLNDSRVDPSMDSNSPIQLAVISGRFEACKLLLNDSRVNPSESNQTFLEAVSLGHTDIVKLLLNDSRIDPSIDENDALQFAAQKGHTDIVKLLLKDKRVDPTGALNHSIKYAFSYNNLDIVDILWDDNRVKNTLKHDAPRIYNELILKDIKNKVEKF